MWESKKEIQYKERKESQDQEKVKILLAFLPFWTPYIPPQGITTLKAYLRKHGYRVTTADPNMDMEFRELYNEYFRLMKQYVPYEKRGNFFNIGHDVLYNHMMAHIHYTDEKEYIELVKIIVEKTYYHPLTHQEVIALNQVLTEFYRRLRNYILDLVNREKPAVFGTTAYSGTLPACLFAAKLVKENYPQIKTVIGGGSFADQLVKGTPNFERFLNKCPYIDKVFIGQGQILFLKWLRGELPENQRVYSLEDIHRETVAINTDVDIPDLSDVRVKDYLYMASVGSRSCSYSCSFCNVRKFWGEHKRKNIQQTANEMIMQYKKYGTQLFFMYDSLLNTIIAELSEEFLRSEYSIYYIGYLRACKEACDIDNTLQWRRGGFYRARLGLESASQKILDIIGKQINPELMKGTLAGLAYAGIKTTAYFIIGHPGETEEDFQQTMDFVEECKNDFWEVECNPFNYYYAGQNSFDQWAPKRKLLYPEKATEWLISQTWTLDIEPSREEVYRRMNRFVQHCDKLGLPNPYSVQEIYKADDRWKKLHKNAVPSIAELRDTNRYTQECKQVKDLSLAQSLVEEEGDFVL